MELLDNADKYGLTEIKAEKISIKQNPLQLDCDNTIYLMDFPDYVQDINLDLYKYLIQEYKNQNKLLIRLYKEMIKSSITLRFEKYYGKDIDLQKLEKEPLNFKNITYNPENNDKFIAVIDTKKCFIHIYEFISETVNYKAKYIHAEYKNNTIIHMDYSINQYSKEQYNNIIINPNNIEKTINHKKIWRLDGVISIESFYNIIFCMFDKNEQYIKELFNVEI